MYCCDKCKIKSIKMRHSKPCGYDSFNYKGDGGVCGICGENDDVFFRPEMVGFREASPPKRKTRVKANKDGTFTAIDKLNAGDPVYLVNGE